MAFWKKAPPPPWHDRLQRARKLIEDHHNDSSIVDSSIVVRVDEVERSLADSLDDQKRLRAALEALSPDEATSALKRALRERLDPTAPDTALIITLRERHESINELRNRLEALERQQEATLVDLESVAAHVVEHSTSSVARPFASELDRLRADAEALRAARAEIEHL
jgi:hypothetical protein